MQQAAHPEEMAGLTGHSSVQITLDRYTRVMPHMVAALAERMTPPTPLIRHGALGHACQAVLTAPAGLGDLSWTCR